MSASQQGSYSSDDPKMKFSVPAFLATVGAVLLSGVVAFWEGYLTDKRVTMGFLSHGGMWGDLLLMSLVMALVVPNLIHDRIYVLPSLAFSLLITILAHAQWCRWMRLDATTGHMFPTHSAGRWYIDMSISGWMHLVFMTIMLGVLFVYVLSPMPIRVVVAVAILLSVHMLVGTLQPGLHLAVGPWKWRILLMPSLAVILIWIINGLKIWLTK